MAYILAIDDNAVIRDVMKFTLQHRHSVTMAETAKEALGHVGSKRFDLIITDIGMPDMNGVEFIKEVRKLDAYKKTPIVVLTANLAEHKDKTKEAGATGWILKPFEPNKLLSIIDELLKK